MAKLEPPPKELPGFPNKYSEDSIRTLIDFFRKTNFHPSELEGCVDAKPDGSKVIFYDGPEQSRTAFWFCPAQNIPVTVYSNKRLSDYDLSFHLHKVIENIAGQLRAR